MTQIRMKREHRHQQLLQIACNIAKAQGINACTRIAVAKAADITPPNVNRYWANPDLMRREVLQLAVNAKDVEWLRKCHADGCKFQGVRMPSELRREVVAKG